MKVQGNVGSVRHILEMSSCVTEREETEKRQQQYVSHRVIKYLW